MIKANPEPIPQMVHKGTFSGTTLLRMAQINTEPNENVRAPKVLKIFQKMKTFQTIYFIIDIPVQDSVFIW